MDTADFRRLWATAKGELQLQLTPDIYEMYIHPLQAMDMATDTLVLGCPNSFVRDWLEQRLDRVVVRSLSGIAGKAIKASYVLAQPNQQMALDVATEPSALVRPGDLRQAGFVMLWHDLRTFYGPMIGLAGVGLWTEFRSAVQSDERHPLNGYAWIGLRALMSQYAEGRAAITKALHALRDADLVDWRTGADLSSLWEQQKAAGVSDRDNAGVSGKVLGRFLSDPINSHIYTVSDPLELPAFAAKFQKAISLDVQAERCSFVDYPGRITARWQEWLKRLMAANGMTVIEPADWFRLGLQ